MELLIEELPQRITGEERRVQFRYYWTRTEIGAPEAFRFRKANGEKITGPVAEIKRDGTYVVLDLHSEAARLVSSVAVPYRGEPLQLLSKRWLGDVFVLRAQFTDIGEWFQCRRENCETPAHTFFLALDEATNLLLLPDDGGGRRTFVQSLQRCLLQRIERRATQPHMPLPPPIGQSEQIRAIGEELEKLIVEKFQGDVESAKVAFEAFAAGNLQQKCEIDGMRIVASDADSAFLFLFAELVLAVIDLYESGQEFSEDPRWQHLYRFWRPFLRHFVRMQEIYLARFGDKRQCFKYYRRAEQCFGGKFPEPSCTASVPDEVPALIHAMKCNLKKTIDPKRPRDCFKNLW